MTEKQYRFTAAQLIGRPKYPWGDGSGAWYDNHKDWDGEALEKLEVLCEANIPVETIADIIGRKPSSIVHRALGLGLSVPAEWRSLVSCYKSKLREPKTQLLCYPYIIKARPEHADLLEINSLIPRRVLPHMRADMVQSIMLALFEGRVTMDALRAGRENVHLYMKQFYKDNFEAAGHAVSLSGNDDEREYYDIAASMERQGSFAPATQEDAVFENQIMAIHRKRTEEAMRVGSTQRFVSLEEIRAEFS